MKNDTQPWSDQDYKITIHPPYLKGGYLIQQPETIPKGTNVSIVVTGNVTIYVAIQLTQQTGGYEVSLPGDGWEMKNGKIGLGEVAKWDLDLTTIYSKDYRTKTKTQIFLPPTTTTETYMIITVVPICSGNLIAIIS